MATIDAQRNQMIRRAVLQRPEAVADVTIDLWEKLAAKLTAIIGEGGFQSLYSRSIHLVRTSFPWIAQESAPISTGSQFAQLKHSLEGRAFPEASEASILLLITLIDILTMLIGEPLTASILRSAWGKSAFDIDGEELQ